MSGQYVWLDEYIRHIAYVYLGKYTYKQITDEEMKTEIRNIVRKELLKRLRLIFGKFWNRECNERLRTITREAGVEKYNRVSESCEKNSEYAKLLDKLELIGMYVIYKINCDNLQLSDEPIASIMKLFASILEARTIHDELNQYVAEGFDRYCTQFAKEWDSEYDPLTADDDRISDICKKIYKKNQKWLERRNEKLQKMKRVPEDSEVLKAFCDKVSKVRNILEKKYSRYYDDVLNCSELKNVIYEEASESAVRKDTDANEKKGRKFADDALYLDFDAEDEYIRNSALNVMSNEEFSFLCRIGSYKLKIDSCVPEEVWTNVSMEVRAEIAEAVETFAQESAIFAYVNVIPNDRVSAIHIITSTIRNPLFPKQKEIGETLRYLLEISNQNHLTNGRYSFLEIWEFDWKDHVRINQYNTVILNGIEQRLAKITDRLGIQDGTTILPYTLPSKAANGANLWVEDFIGDKENSEKTQVRDIHIVFDRIIQVLQLIFAEYLRPECALRLAESVYEHDGKVVYPENDMSTVYDIYDQFCRMVYTFRWLVRVFYDDCEKNKTKNGRSWKRTGEKIIKLIKEAARYTDALQDVDYKSEEQFRIFRAKAEAIYSDEKCNYKNLKHRDLFCKSLAKKKEMSDIVERRTKDKIREYGEKTLTRQKEFFTEPFSVLETAEYTFKEMYGFIWTKYFDLNDARKINRKHLSYEEQYKEYDKKMAEHDKIIKNADKKHKSIKAGENPLPSKPDSSGLERDYRYRISAAEKDFLKCIFQIVSKLGRRIKTITADNLSREDRELLIEAVNKFSEDPNIHLYMYLKQGSRASVSRFAEYNFNNPQAARIRAAIRDIYTFVQNKKLLKCGADQKTITEIYVLFDDLRQYIESKENAYIDKNEEFKGPLTDESADNFMESVINDWLNDKTPYMREKAEKAMFGDQEEHK